MADVQMAPLSQGLTSPICERVSQLVIKGYRGFQGLVPVEKHYRVVDLLLSLFDHQLVSHQKSCGSYFLVSQGR